MARDVKINPAEARAAARVLFIADMLEQFIAGEETKYLDQPMAGKLRRASMLMSEVADWKVPNRKKGGTRARENTLPPR